MPANSSVSSAPPASHKGQGGEWSEPGAGAATGGVGGDEASGLEPVSPVMVAGSGVEGAGAGKSRPAG